MVPAKKTPSDILAAGHARAEQARVNMLVAAEATSVSAEVAAAEEAAAATCAPRPPHSDARIAPNSVLRSALFAALPRDQKQRALLRRSPVASLQGISVNYTGYQLDQRDLDLWLTILHLHDGRRLGELIELSSYQLLKALGVGDSGETREDLAASLERLHAGQVVIRQGKGIYMGHLLDEAARREDGAGWRVRLSPRMVEILGPADWTGLDWPVRRELRGKPLAQWLHGYLSSHDQAHALRPDTLRELSGSRAAPRSFATSLRRALSALATAAAKHGRPFSWSLPAGGLLKASRPRRDDQ
jgi:hypothetical protein